MAFLLKRLSFQKSNKNHHVYIQFQQLYEVVTKNQHIVFLLKWKVKREV